MTTILPKSQPARWVVRLAGKIELDGITNVGELTGMNPAYETLYGEGEVAFLAAAKGAAGTYKPLPDVGQRVEAGEVYSYAGDMVIARQTHARTKDAPADAPELFATWKEDAPAVLEWIAGEKVDVKWQRVYEKVTYVCLKAHICEKDLTPDRARELWATAAAGKVPA